MSAHRLSQAARSAITKYEQELLIERGPEMKEP